MLSILSMIKIILFYSLLFYLEYHMSTDQRESQSGYSMMLFLSCSCTDQDSAFRSIQLSAWSHDPRSLALGVLLVIVFGVRIGVLAPAGESSSDRSFRPSRLTLLEAPNEWPLSTVVELAWNKETRSKHQMSFEELCLLCIAAGPAQPESESPRTDCGNQHCSRSRGHHAECNDQHCQRSQRQGGPHGEGMGLLGGHGAITKGWCKLSWKPWSEGVQSLPNWIKAVEAEVSFEPSTVLKRYHTAKLHYDTLCVFCQRRAPKNWLPLNGVGLWDWSSYPPMVMVRSSVRSCRDITWHGDPKDWCLHHQRFGCPLMSPTHSLCIWRILAALLEARSKQQRLVTKTVTWSERRGRQQADSWRCALNANGILTKFGLLAFFGSISSWRSCVKLPTVELTPIRSS